MKAWNTNYTDAMAEARKQVTASQAPTPTAPTPAPIAPQPIQPAPVTPTQQVPPQPIQPAPAPTQPTDWMGDFSQIKKREPVSPTAVTPEPVAPAPVTPTTPKTVKPEVPVVNRQQEIQNNLATGYQTNPWLFTDRAAYDKAYNYATKSPEEQATLDSFYNSKQPTISSMYSAIINKQEVPDSTKMTPAYKIAQNRYSKASSFSSMTPSQLSDQMKNAKLVEWSQAFEDLKAINPKLVQDATNLRKVNGDTTNIWTNNPDGTKVNNLEKSIADDYTDNFGEFIKTMYKVYTPAEITAIIRTPDVVAAEDKAFAIEKSINELDKQMANIDSEVDTEFKWSGATGSRLAMEKAARRDVLNKDRDSQVREYTTYANRASNLITQNTTSFQTQQQQQQAQNAAMLPFITDQYKTAQAKKQAEQALNDPATQIKATMDEFAKLGIVSQWSLPQKIAEANAFIAKGGTLGEYVNNLRKLYMEKPEYKKMLALNAGQLSDVEKFQLQSAQSERSDIRNFQQQIEIAKMNGDITRQNYLFQMQNDPEKQKALLEIQSLLGSDKSLFDVLGKNAWTYEGNRGYDLAGKLGDPMVAGGNWTVKSIDQAWEFGIPYKVGIKKPYGNTVVMVDENGNEVRYSHLDTIWVKPWDKIGFGDVVGTRGNTWNVKWGNGEILSADQLKAGRGSHLDIEIKDPSGRLLSQNEQIDYLKSKKSSGWISPEAKSYLDIYNKWTMDLETILTKLWTAKEATPLKNEIIKAVSTQWGKQVRQADDPAVVSLQNRINDLKFLKDNEFMDSVVGANTLGRTSFSNFYSGGKDEYLSKVKQFLSSDVIQTLIDAKAKWATFWALSDAELAQIKNSSNALAGRAIYDGDNIVDNIVGFKWSEESFKEELQKLIDSTDKAIVKMTWSKIESVNNTKNTNTVVNDPFWIR